MALANSNCSQILLVNLVRLISWLHNAVIRLLNSLIIFKCSSPTYWEEILPSWTCFVRCLHMSFPTSFSLLIISGHSLDAMLRCLHHAVLWEKIIKIYLHSNNKSNLYISISHYHFSVHQRRQMLPRVVHVPYLPPLPINI